jgi:hypothetical protein
MSNVVVDGANVLFEICVIQVGLLIYRVHRMWLLMGGQSSVVATWDMCISNAGNVFETDVV